LKSGTLLAIQLASIGIDSMNTDLDIAHDWVLLNANYSDGRLTTFLSDRISAELTRKATVQFDKVFHYLIAEEAQDSLWSNDFPNDVGFIKKYSTASSHLAKKLNLTFWPFYEASNHYRLITRDEVIHVFSNSDPAILVTEIT
jgi:hypothetical protein